MNILSLRKTINFAFYRILGGGHQPERIMTIVRKRTGAGLAFCHIFTALSYFFRHLSKF